MINTEEIRAQFPAGFSVHTDRDTGDDFRPMVAVEYIMRQGVKVTHGSEVASAVPMLKEWMQDTMIRDAKALDPIRFALLTEQVPS